jgi:AhpD family alkylhydroperoxidase
MAHITLPEGIPGIRGPMMFRPETAAPLNQLVEVLLRGPHSLSPGERELIATYVSAQNDCTYCQTIHGAIAAHHLNANEQLVSCVKSDFERADILPKLKALLAIANIRTLPALVAKTGYTASVATPSPIPPLAG